MSCGGELGTASDRAAKRQENALQSSAHRLLAVGGEIHMNGSSRGRTPDPLEQRSGGEVVALGLTARQTRKVDHDILRARESDR